MTALAPTLEAFFTQRLIAQRRSSPHTIAAYRDTFRLLLRFVQEATTTPPAKLDLHDLDAPLVGAFLDHLEADRGVAVSTRNARLAAVHSFSAPNRAGRFTMVRISSMSHRARSGRVDPAVDATGSGRRATDRRGEHRAWAAATHDQERQRPQSRIIRSDRGCQGPSRTR